MATEEHKYLAGVIKKTHATLRKEAQDHGPEIAWNRHITRKDVLQEYAHSMQKLATTYWMKNNLNTESSTHSRIEWIKFQCQEYFLNGGSEKYNNREESIRIKINTNNLESTEVPIHYNSSIENKESPIPKYLDNNTDFFAQKIALLDVGSCYNPFGSFNIFEVTAIDLYGIPDKVLGCDFLNVHIGKEKILSDNKEEVLLLPQNSFNVVVFSLFLEYLPCPKQRYICCKKAYDLLQVGGILFIITPDSKHVHANAKLMKSWRYVLSKLGFMRIKYEKLRHMHCIVFRKCIFKDVATRWANLQNLSSDDPLYFDSTAIYIPQDFRNESDEIKHQEQEEYDSDEITSMFGELPFDP
ncbi:S-adenosylmethionine sensor upstream of TORC1 isoform X1 [Osmia lignaria lignaria]|uniref:S-adenosylmethionine sensor upstream of TORC1 isoform X1 n=1 Tax=Osmia lignaria lignaria TaxID=1437193 RepID=UPI00402B3314